MSVDLGTARAVVVLDTAQLAKGVAQANAQFKSLEGSTAGLSSALSGVSTSLGLIGGAIGVSVGAAVKSFGDFESTINTLGAVTGVAGAHLQELSGLALEIGENTTFGATEAAAGLTELAKAGIDVEDIIAGAGEAAANLAAAGGVDLARAAEVMATSLNQFALAGEDAAHVADLFAAGANKSAADVDQLAQSLQQVGTVAHGFGLSIEETVASLSLFADAGLKGSDAGTSFKTALTSMLVPVDTGAAKMKALGISFRDANGEFVGMARAADILRDALEPLSAAQRDAALQAIFGQDALRVGTILYQEGGAAVREYTTAVNDSGAAQDVAAARTQGLNGALEQLQGAIENASIAFGSALAPAVQAAADHVASVVNAFSALSPQLQQLAAGSVAAVGGVALLGAAIAKVAAIALDSIGTFKRLTAAIQASSKAMAVLRFGFSPVAIGLAGLATVAGILIAEHQKQQQAAEDLATAYRDLAAAINEMKFFGSSAQVQSLQMVTTLLEELASTSEDVRREVTELQKEHGLLDLIPDPGAVDEFGNALDGVTVSVGNLQRRLADAQISEEELAQVTSMATEALTTQGVDVDRVFNAIAAALATYTTSMEDLSASADAPEILIATLQRLLDDIGDYKVVSGEATDATNAQTEAEQRAAAATQARIDAYTDLNAAIAAASKAAGSPVENLAKQQREEAERAAEDAKRVAERAAEDRAEAEEKVQRAIQDTIDETLNQVRAVEDLFPALDGLQEGYANVGDSVETMTLKLAEAGKISLDPLEKDALGAVRALQRLERKGEKLSAAIANNADDMSMWEGRISLVTDTLGGNTEALDDWLGKLERGEVTQEQFNAAVANTDISKFDKLNALYESGAISQETYNEAREAGIFLLQRGAGALGDEREELTGNIIALADYVKAHDNAHGSVKALSDEQKGFLAALQETNSQLALQTLNLLAMLAAMGLIPEEKVTDYIFDAAAADPVLAALFEDLGLLDENDEKSTEFTVTGDGTADIKGAQEALDQLTDKPVNITVTVTTTTDEDSSPFKRLREGVAITTTLAPPEDTSVDVEPDDVEVPTKLAPPDETAVTGYEPAPIEIPTILAAPDDAAVTSYEPTPIVIPTVLGAPGAAGGEGAAVSGPSTVTIPTVYGAPSWPEGAALQGPDPVTIPTVYGAPDTTELATFDASVYTTTLDAETTGFDDSMTDTTKSGDTFAGRTFTTTLDADSAPAITTLNDIVASLETYEQDTFTTTLDANNDLALGAIAEATLAANLFDRTYTATLQANIQPALDSLQTLADNLPSSPAKEGPLSKEPDFDYVVDAFVASIAKIKDLAGEAAYDLGPRIATSLRAGEFATLARGPVPGGAAAAGTTIVDARSFYALTGDEMQRLLTGAEMGAGAHDWIARRELAFATMGA